MPLFYPSFDALRLADRLLDEIGKQTPGYEGRVGTAWYWRLPAGILVVARLDHTVTEERWDVLRAQASTPRAGIFSTADFPFKAYGTSATSPPFSPPAAFPALSPLERRLVRYALDELGGTFNVQELHQAFGEEISRARLRRLAQAWEARELLTARPRRVTYALRLLAEEDRV
jgi:hypothetical protein